MTRAQPARFAMVVGFIFALVATPVLAQDDVRTFETGSLVIPMDIDYQDDGMLKAFGLLYQLLLNDITVYWVIDADKDPGGVDFYVAATDTDTAAVITDLDEDEVPTGDHGYRAGPFVVDVADAEAALVVIEAWQDDNTTAVHETTEAFSGTVARELTVAPTIGVFADGHEDIAFRYLNSAGIPDSRGEAWPDRKDNDQDYPGYSDILTVDMIRGSDDQPNDGVLFDDNGLPVFCQLMTMHWGVGDRNRDGNIEVVREVREFLQFPTHFFAECQAVNAIENAIEGEGDDEERVGFFLTPNGYDIGQQPSGVDQRNVHLPFGQFDGEFETTNGSEPAYSLPGDDEYYDAGVVMLTEAGTDIGINDVWMTGYFGGACAIDPKGEEVECTTDVGKVSYLGGHQYSTDLPISENPETQGTRLFLNALFEADCISTIGQPDIDLAVRGPAVTNTAAFQLRLVIENRAPGIALNPVLSATLPTNLDFVEASPAPDTNDGQDLTWNMPNIGPRDTGTVVVTVEAQVEGTFLNSAVLQYTVGQNTRSVSGGPLSTLYDPDAVILDDVGPGDGAGDDNNGDAGNGGDTDAGNGGDTDAGNGGDTDPGNGDASESDADEGDGVGQDSGGDSDGSDVGGADNGTDSNGANGGGSGTAEEGCECGSVPSRRAPWLALALVALVFFRRRQ